MQKPEQGALPTAAVKCTQYTLAPLLLLIRRESSFYMKDDLLASRE